MKHEEEGMSMSEICPVCQARVSATDTSCPQCGFKLLGATQEFRPVSVDGHERAARRAETRDAVLRVVRGPQAGVSYKLSGDELTVGRSPHCSIFLNDMTVSRMHATLRRESGCYVIYDENSYNGVWVNDKNVEAKALSSGDFVQIGAFCLLFEQNGRMEA